MVNSLSEPAMEDKFIAKKEMLPVLKIDHDFIYFQTVNCHIKAKQQRTLRIEKETPFERKLYSFQQTT